MNLINAKRQRNEKIVHRYVVYGESIPAIARVLGLSPGCVQKVLVKMGVPRRPVGRAKA